MTVNVLIIPWHNRDHEVVILLNLMLTELGYSPIVLDKFLPEVQFNDIEKTYLLHKPKIIITLFEEEDRYFGQNLCKLVKGNLLTQNIGLLYLVSRRADVHIHWLPVKDPCFADEYISIPFSPEELKNKLHQIINKSSNPS